MLNSRLKKLFTLFVFVFISAKIFAQDNGVLLKEAQNLELKFDEAGALEKYKQLATNDPSNINALVKCAELNCSIGNRQKDKATKLQYFQLAQDFAQQAYTKDSMNADACYANALVATRMSETDDDNKKFVENKKLIEDIKQIKIYSDKALAAKSKSCKSKLYFR